MKSKMKIIQFFIVFISFVNLGSSQGHEIGFNYLFSVEKLVGLDISDFYKSEVFHSVGVSGKHYFSPKAFIAAGIGYRSFGSRTEVKVTTVQNPEGTGEVENAIWKAQGIELPVSLGYYFINQDKIKIGASAGFSSFLLNKQSYEIRGNVADLELFEKYIYSLKVNLELRLLLNEKISLNVRPVFQRQISSNIDWMVNSIDIILKQRSIGCELGLSYNL